MPTTRPDEPAPAGARSPPRRVDFWSSTEYSTFLPALVGALGDLGWHGRARFAVTEATYREARSPLARSVLRARTYGVYPIGLALAIRRARADVSVVCTNTFYAPLTAALAAGDHPVVHWVFDLYPDVLVHAGTLRAGSVLERAATRWVRRTFERAAANVFLGDHLLAAARSRFGDIPRAHVIPIGADPRPFADGLAPVGPGEAVTVLYCGNLGRLHDVETVARLLERGGAPARIRWAVHGNGAGVARLRRAARTTPRFELSGSLSAERWARTLRAAPVGLVTLAPGAEELAVPSKAYSAMAAGQALLAICPSRSDLATLVRRHDCGWVIEPGDVAALESALTEIAAVGGPLAARRQAAWNAARDHYSASVLAPRWATLLETARASGRRWR